jgi:hypothetical protein
VISTVLRFLEPHTTYAVQIRTIDIGGNPSPISDPAAVTTLPANANDTTPPTVPSPVWADSFGDLEMSLSWGQSTDDFDAQANIRYDVYVNGRFEDVVFGSGGRESFTVQAPARTSSKCSRPTPLAIHRRRAPSRNSCDPHNIRAERF